MAVKKPNRTPVAELPFSQRTKRGLYEENVYQRDLIAALGSDLAHFRKSLDDALQLRAKVESAPTEDQVAEAAHLVGLLQALQFAARLDTALDPPTPSVGNRSAIICHATHVVTYLCALAYSHAAAASPEEDEGGS